MNHNIICISTVGWDVPLWTNKQQIMSRLAITNKVLYIEPLVSILTVIKYFSELKYRLSLFGKVIKKSENLYIYSPPLVFPLGHKFSFINKINSIIITFFIKRVIKKYKFDNPILWIYSPISEYFVGNLNEKLSCYDCVDEYTGFPGASKSSMQDMEIKLLKKVNLVFTTTHNLYNEKSKYNSNTHFVPNVGDFELFSKALKEETKIPDDISNIKSPIIGFIGSINYKIDIKLLEFIAESRPDWSIVMIGPIDNVDVSSLDKFNNVHFLGTRKRETLPNYAKVFDVCIIPYITNQYTANVFPLKFFEYLATGKPVVTTDLPELRYYKDIVKIASNKNEFVKFIDESLKNDNDELKMKRIEIAKANSWDSRIHKIVELIEKQEESLMNKIH